MVFTVKWNRTSDEASDVASLYINVRPDLSNVVARFDPVLQGVPTAQLSLRSEDSAGAMAQRRQRAPVTDQQVDDILSGSGRNRASDRFNRSVTRFLAPGQSQRRARLGIRGVHPP